MGSHEMLLIIAWNKKKRDRKRSPFSILPVGLGRLFDVTLRNGIGTVNWETTVLWQSHKKTAPEGAASLTGRRFC